MTLKKFFEENRAAALAFSGGVDSSYLLYAGVSEGCDICAYYVKTEFQPQFEFDDAVRFASEIGAKLKVIEMSALTDDHVRKNAPDRCYHCKKRIFSAISREATRDGYSLIIDGTNASDDADDRPGMRALDELGVRSPLRECGMMKDEIRELSRIAGLFTWSKPAYACLATRTATGTELTAEALETTERAEGELEAMGFRDFRIRTVGKSAKIQVKKEQLEKILVCRELILEKLAPYYDGVTLDLEVR